MNGSACSPRPHESAVPGWCTSRPHATMQSDAPARERRPPASLPVGAGTAARSAAKGEYHPAVRMTLNAGVPAERGAPRTRGPSRRPPAAGCADRRSAFPGGRRHLDPWGSRVGLHFHSNWRRSLASGPRCRSEGPHRETGRRSSPPRASPGSGADFARLRRAMPVWRPALPGAPTRSRRRRCFPAPRRGCRASGGRP